MFGFINLHKPVGFTSHDCVAKLRRLLNTRKIGHGGTLDPAATGVLPIAVGKATRLLQFLPEPKAYRAKIRLGVTTTTDDLEGEIIQQVDSVNFNPADIVAGLENFVGTIQQVPPIYSAIKKDGKKLYEMARKGQEVKIAPRTVTISKIELINICQTEFYEVEADIYCSPGTYIRAIARDLGKNLGVGGTLGNLIRTESCGMQLDNSLTFAEIETRLQNSTFNLVDPSLMLTHLAHVTLSESDAKLFCHGQLLDLTQAVDSSQDISTFEPDSYLIVYESTGTFLGVSTLIERNEVIKIKPKIVFSQ